MDIAGHVSKAMLKHYSHIRMEAKRKALESVVENRTQKTTEENAPQSGQNHPLLHRILKESTHRSPHSWVFLRVIEELIGGVNRRNELAPQVGLEPTTLRLTVARKRFSADYRQCLWSTQTPAFMRVPRPSRLLSDTAVC